MKNVVRTGLLLASCGVFCTGRADGPFAGVAEAAVHALAADAAQSGSMSLSGEGEAFKTGVGTWFLPWGALGSWEPQRIFVKNGSLSLDLDDTAERAADCPRDVLDAKALFWFDASFLDDHPAFFGASVVGEKRYLNSMYDVRENFAGGVRQRPYVSANHYLRVVQAGKPDGSSANTETKWDAEKMPSPELVTRNGRTAIWFGGVGSGRSMSVFRKGESVISSLADVVHVFAVTDAPEGWGALCYPGFRPTGVWTGAAEGSWQSPILHTDECLRYSGNRTYFNGVRKDAQKDGPVKGFSLFECELFTTPVSVNRLFYATSGAGSSNVIADNDDGTRAVKVQCGGGDYLYEVICFTNRLTGAERQRVVGYLQRKWFPDAAKTASVEGAAGTTVVVKGAGTAVVTRASEANLVKEGPGDLWFRRDANDLAEQRGPVAFGDGAGRVLAQRPVPFAVEPGRRYTAEAGAEAVAVSSTALAGGQAARVVKDGNADLMVRGMPDAVKEVEVADGTLVVRPRGPSARSGLDGADDEVFIPIRNASFEERVPGQENNAVVTYASGIPYCGWVMLPNVRSGCQCVYNLDKWPDDGATVGIDGAKRSAWGLDARPHGGSAVLLRMNAGIRTEASFELKAGRYQVDFWTNTRWRETGGLVDVVLVDPETFVETVVAHQVQIYTRDTGFGRVPCRFTVPSDRRCHLGFRVNESTDYSADNSGMRVVTLDDISLRRIASRPDTTEWAIPGGDFEAIEGEGMAAMFSRTFTRDITHPDWRLTQPAGSGAADYDLGCGFANRYMCESGVYEVPCYNDSRAPFQSTILTFMVGGASASTTFTPPKGTWYLKGDIAMNGPHSTCTLSAKATINGAEYGLGTLAPQNKVFKTCRFTGGTIVSDGVTPVTLTLTYAYPGTATKTLNRPVVYVDDLMLTKVLDDAALAHGEPVFRHTFEDASHAGWTQIVRSADNGGGATFPYASVGASHSAEGETLGGLNGCYIRHNGGVVLHRDFGKAGTYRLSLFMNRRPNQAGTNPVHVWLARNGVTNEIAVLRAGTEWRTERSAVFRIPEGESYEYDIGFEGTYAGPKWAANDEYGLRCSDTVVDDLTVVRVGDEELVRTDAVFAKDTAIEVGEHGRLQLDFDGTNRVGRVTFRNHAVTGVVSAQTHPEFVSGQGALAVLPGSTALFIR